MVQNNQKTGFYAVFFHFGAIWAPPYGLKKVSKGPQVGGKYGPRSKLKKKPLTKLGEIIRPILLREMVQNNQKTGFYAAFFPF
jgi:hypothetical protein